VLLSHPDVSDALVEVEADRRGRIRPVATIRPRRKVDGLSASLMRLCRERLGHHEVPRWIVIDEALAETRK
jgi:acyl-coenzyme A synthetase/AMP-(fatty) acid ligase